MTVKKIQDKSGSKAQPTIVWLRQDLRLGDQPALQAAALRGAPVLIVYIWAPQEEAPWAPGAASKVWLHFSLKNLDSTLQDLGSQLLIFDLSTAREQTSLDLLTELSRCTGAAALFWNRRYEPVVIERDKKIKTHLQSLGLTVESFKGALLLEPWEVLTKQGKPYQVFTPYWQSCQMAMQAQLAPRQPLPAPLALPDPGDLIKILKNHPRNEMHPVNIDSLALLPTVAWDGGIKESWEPGEFGALKQLETFLQDGLAQYKEGRDKPAEEGVSRLSAHLHFGEISPQTIWHRVTQHAAEKRKDLKTREAAQSFLRELGWREFSHHILYHFPHTDESPLRPAFNQFPWAKNKDGFKAWSKGLTGYPIVDAGMRELWHTGIMHNRVRMITASFLVKDLLIPWQDGARWFWQTLVDADLAQNSLGWQWTAGCGADAAPYFRIFNPTLQGEKFDPRGSYVRRWVPELAGLPDKWIHQPWMAPPAVLAQAAVNLGKNYPLPIVDHSYARDRALTAFKALKQSEPLAST